ncbi:hypothetical protein [Achromobacter mucicolens]|uniref:hypothetical protein n=1 Tax=Achromobacter mucicolens TaxID=1389922 RepID=UPI0039767255
MAKTNDVTDDAVSQAFYTAYKPFRNALRTLSLEESLHILWQYSVHLSGDVEIPEMARVLGLDRRGVPLHVADYIHHWDLALLAREVLLNASARGHASLLELPVLKRIFNHVKDLSSFRPEPNWQQLLLHMHRLAHQQFPVQRGVQVSDLMRYKLIFEHPGMNGVFEKGVGLSPKVFYFLGCAVAGAVKSKPFFVTSADFTSFGISDDERDSFFSRMAAPTALLKERILGTQRFGRSWAFTVNPLQSTPLVNVDPLFPDRVYCPIPGLVLRRITSGVYYDLVKIDGFENGFGFAFEHYIGLVMRKSCKKAIPWAVHKPQPYMVGKKRKHHGADWILSDGTANLFIECKATRIRAEAISAETYSDVEKTVQRLADMVVQNYANISDALSGVTDWTPNNLPSFSVVTTLEDFIAFGGVVAQPVREKVIEGLRAKGLPEELVDQVPYSLVSAAEFEGICAVLNEHSAFHLFSAKNKGECSQWLFSAFCAQPAYRDTWALARRLHGDELTAFWHQANEMSGGLFRIPSPDGTATE